MGSVPSSSIRSESGGLNSEAGSVFSQPIEGLFDSRLPVGGDESPTGDGELPVADLIAGESSIRAEPCGPLCRAGACRLSLPPRLAGAAFDFSTNGFDESIERRRVFAAHDDRDVGLRPRGRFVDGNDHAIGRQPRRGGSPVAAEAFTEKPAPA